MSTESVDWPTRVSVSNSISIWLCLLTSDEWWIHNMYSSRQAHDTRTYKLWVRVWSDKIITIIRIYTELLAICGHCHAFCSYSSNWTECRTASLAKRWQWAGLLHSRQSESETVIVDAAINHHQLNCALVRLINLNYLIDGWWNVIPFRLACGSGLRVRRTVFEWSHLLICMP